MNVPVAMQQTSDSLALLWYLSRVLLPMVRAAQIVRQKLDDKLDVVARKLLINFMAGRTAARLGAS